ncbi:OmpA family protein [Segatella copri]|uniref:OmpA family protein n=1 Tax=Segatella copri TaxID=165179 RepID=UPI002FEF5A43
MWAIGTLNGLTTLATETTKVVVTGYADKGTGNDVINDRIAAKRAAAVVWMLTKKYNIPSERITEESKGARVQPFAENAENRVTIMIAK